MNPLPLILLGLVGYVLFDKAKEQATNLVQSLSYRISDASLLLRDITMDSVPAKIVVSVTNASQNGFDITGVSGNLIFKNSVIATVLSNEKKRIVPLGTTTITLSALIPVAGLTSSVAELVNLIKAGENPVLTLKGKVFFESGSLNLSVSKQFKIV